MPKLPSIIRDYPIEPVALSLILLKVTWAFWLLGSAFFRLTKAIEINYLIGSIFAILATIQFIAFKKNSLLFQAILIGVAAAIWMLLVTIFLRFSSWFGVWFIVTYIYPLNLWIFWRLLKSRHDRI
jgi:hypothetical protein